MVPPKTGATARAAFPKVLANPFTAPRLPLGDALFTMSEMPAMMMGPHVPRAATSNATNIHVATGSDANNGVRGCNKNATTFTIKAQRSNNTMPYW